jgi:prophage antirepressor-like protein
MEKLQNYQFEKKNLEVIVSEGGDLLFVAVDVCNILGLTNTTKAVKQLDEDEYLPYPLVRAGQKRDTNVITESGLYALIIRSNKPAAKKFRKWVTSEVLPSIRKNGSYSSIQSEAIEDKEAMQRIYKELDSLEAINKANNKRMKELRANVKMISLKDYSAPNLFSIS